MLIPLRWWLILAMLFGAGFTVLQRLGETSVFPLSEDDALRTQLAQRWAQKVAFDVTDLPGRPKVAVARVVNDDHGILTSQLKQWIGRRNVRMENHQWYDSVGYRLGTSKEPESIVQAIQPLLGPGVDYVVAAHVEDWTTYPEFEARLVGYVEICDGKTGETVLEYQLSMPERIDVAKTDESTASGKSIDGQSDPKVTKTVAAQLPTASNDADPPTERDTKYQLALVAPHSQFPWTGFTGWGLVLAVIPTLVRTRLRRLLSRKCNRTNGILLASWLLSAFSLAAVLWVRSMPAAWGIPVGMIAVFLSAVYFAWSCQCLETTR